MESSYSFPRGIQCSKITHKYWENFASVTPRTRIPQDEDCLRVEFYHVVFFDERQTNVEGILFLLSKICWCLILGQGRL